MIPWEEYIRSNISDFRRAYRKYPRKTKRAIEESESASICTLNKPTQVVVIAFNKPFPTCLVILHSQDYPDMKSMVFDNVIFKDFFSRISKEEPKLPEILGIKEDEFLKAITDGMTFGWEWSILWDKNTIAFIAQDDPRIDERSLSNLVQRVAMSTLDRERGRREIEETVDDIRRDAETIEVEELRTKIIGKIEKLESHVEQLGKQSEKLSEDVVGVRKLVGTKAFGEWKVLLTEIDKLNTRVDALSDIKDAYDKVLSQQAEVITQQSSFIKWIKYATILLPIAVISVPVIEVVSILIRHFLGVP